MNKKIKQLNKSVCASDEVVINVNPTNFPDENFRKYVLEKIDKDGDGRLREGEISACKEIDCSSCEINSLKGIEYFTSLEVLDCSRNRLNDLDVSKNNALEMLYCGSNNLSSLDVSKNKVLETLYCGSNNLSSLDVSKNTALKKLFCGNNKLCSLDVSKNKALEMLVCGSNNLSSLDVSKNMSLETLYCGSNNLSSLDVSKNTALKKLFCGNNNLSSLDVSKNTALRYLNCDNNKLSRLDVSEYIVLAELSCDNNNISNLDVSINTVLEKLCCGSNDLSSLDVGKISLYATEEVEINTTNFPDDNFRKYVLEKIDKDGDGRLREGDISACKEIDCSCCEINSLKGIEYFTALEEGREEGRKEEREEGIRLMICDNIDEQIPEERIIAKLMKYFKLSRKAAGEYVKKYAPQPA